MNVTELEPGELVREESDDGKRLELGYRNVGGNVAISRVWLHMGAAVRETDIERMFNYSSGEWDVVSRFVRDYGIASDGVTLAGDGSAWRGTGRDWREWATRRHAERLAIRFKYESDEFDSTGFGK